MADNPETTGKALTQWKPGQSGNPNGRPTGSRHKIAESFLRDFYEAWEAFGRPALLAAAWSKPHEFVKVAASLLPKELHVRQSPLEEMDDAEIDTVLDAIRTKVSADFGTAPHRRTRKAAEPKETGPTGRVN